MTINLDRLLGVLDAARHLGNSDNVILASPEALEAWNELQEAIARFDRYEANITVTCRPCEFCRVAIFFAEISTGRFMPVETETVPAKGMVPAWKYVVIFDSNPPRVVTKPQQADGEVWVDHRNTCGARDGPKHAVPQLVRRWRANQEQVGEINDELREQLLAMRVGLQHGANEVDTRPYEH